MTDSIGRKEKRNRDLVRDGGGNQEWSGGAGGTDYLDRTNLVRKTERRFCSRPMNAARGGRIPPDRQLTAYFIFFYFRYSYYYYYYYYDSTTLLPLEVTSCLRVFSFPVDRQTPQSNPDQLPLHG